MPAFAASSSPSLLSASFLLCICLHFDIYTVETLFLATFRFPFCVSLSLPFRYVAKESRVAVPIILGMVRFWPACNAPKVVLFLNELEHVSSGLFEELVHHLQYTRTQALRSLGRLVEPMPLLRTLGLRILGDCWMRSRDVAAF